MRIHVFYCHGSSSSSAGLLCIFFGWNELYKKRERKDCKHCKLEGERLWWASDARHGELLQETSEHKIANITMKCKWMRRVLVECISHTRLELSDDVCVLIAALEMITSYVLIEWIDLMSRLRRWNYQFDFLAWLTLLPGSDPLLPTFSVRPSDSSRIW